MSIATAFTVVVLAILGAGTAYRRWDSARNLRFADEAGSAVAIAPLARVEARRIGLHAGWLVPLGLLGGVTVLFSALDDQSLTLRGVEPFTYVALALGGLALVAVAHRVGTRSRRNNLEELEAATPTAPRSHTMALVVASAAPVPIAILYVVAITLAVRTVTHPTPLTGSGMMDLGAFVLATVGGAVVGVMLSRWLPVAAAPVVGIVLILYLNNGPDHLHPRYRFLRPAVELNIGGEFDIQPVRWQALFVIGLVALGGCLALWRHPGVPALVVATVASIAVVVSTGWIMSRPPSAEAVAAVADRLENPGRHQTCVERAGVRYCTYEGAAEWVDWWAPGVEGVLAQLPAARRPARLEVTQREPAWPWAYLVEVEEAVDPALAWPEDGKLHPSLTLQVESGPDLGIAWQAAASSLGLPPSVSWRHQNGGMAGGQARQVVAWLLAARATPTTASSFATKVKDVTTEGRQHEAVSADTEPDYGSDTPRGEGDPIPDSALVGADGETERGFVATVGASGWGSDVLAANALLGLDRAAVDSTLAARWAEIVDPATSTADLLGWFGLTEPRGRRSLPLDDPRSCR